MRINYNVSAMLANNALANNDDLLSKSLERLSSGLKVTRAKDNPAGLAMAKRMNAQIEGIDVASQNASDGISVIETAEGALNEVSSMIQRMTELAIQAANDVETDDDRSIIQQEIDQLKQEITRISTSTQFNSQTLLNGNFDLKAYTDNPDVRVSTYNPHVPAGNYMINSLSWTDDPGDVTFSLGAGFPQGNYEATILDNIITINGPDSFSISYDVSNTSSPVTNLSTDCTGIGPMRLQIGSNEGQIIEVAIPAVSLSNMGIEELRVDSVDKAQEAIQRLKKAETFMGDVRGRLGAYQNRLESTANSLGITNENMTAAYSRIMDVDMAEEMTKYSTYTVLNQAGTSVLAQANDRPSSVLQLLQ
jgi:flagellin